MIDDHYRESFFLQTYDNRPWINNENKADLRTRKIRKFYFQKKPYSLMIFGELIILT